MRLGATDYVVKPGDPDGVGEVALEAAIRNALERLSLTSEVQRLRTQVGQDPDGAQPCWSSGKAMQPVMTMVDRVADNDISVLLRGESGVGKEVIAREIHRRSPRRSAPFVKVNCAALPADLLESELFGHERGAFTGAASTRVGKFEFAQHGTIMLDEIGEMPQALQAKILHVLQDREFTKLGSNRTVEVDVRVIAATNRDLEAMMRAGHVPRRPLLPPAGDRSPRSAAARAPRGDSAADRVLPAEVRVGLSPAGRCARRSCCRKRCSRYEWPGNIRELENMMKRLVVLQDETLILAELGRLRTARANAEAEDRYDAHAPMQPAAAIAARCRGRSRPRRHRRPRARFPRRSPRRSRRRRRRVDGRRRRQPPGARAARRDGRREGSDPARARALPLEPPQDRRVPAGELQDAVEQDEGMRDQRVAERA